MSAPWGVTEAADARYARLDAWDDSAILGALLDGQKRALAALDSALADIAKAATAGAAALRAGGRLVYLGAGSPGLIALGDGLEIPQTYGVPRDRIVILMAGGLAMTETLLGGPEDDAEAGAADIAGAGVGPTDCVLCVSASGTTRYTCAGLRAAKAAGAATVAIAGNAGAPMLEDADIAILLDSGAEVISGSTRLGAGTAQKAALNMISTLIGVRLGHVHENFMVNLTADNDKLKIRARAIVARAAGVEDDAAQAALEAARFQVKPAILIAAGARDLPSAQAILDTADGVVREALKMI